MIIAIEKLQHQSQVEKDFHKCKVISNWKIKKKQNKKKNISAEIRDGR